MLRKKIYNISTTIPNQTDGNSSFLFLVYARGSITTYQVTKNWSRVSIRYVLTPLELEAFGLLPKMGKKKFLLVINRFSDAHVVYSAIYVKGTKKF